MEDLILKKIQAAAQSVITAQDLIEGAAKLSRKEMREGEKKLRQELYTIQTQLQYQEDNLLKFTAPEFPVGSRVTRSENSPTKDSRVFEVVGHIFNAPGNWTALLHDPDDADPFSTYGGIGETYLKEVS
jgi:hypothetical protein